MHITNQSTDAKKVEREIPTVNAIAEKKINDQFIRFGTKGGIPIWIEKALLKQLEGKDVAIELTGKFLKKLKVNFRKAQVTPLAKGIRIVNERGKNRHTFSRNTMLF